MAGKQVPAVAINVKLLFERETKGAVLYAEQLAEGEEGTLRNLYIRKSALGEGPYPPAVQVTVTL